MSTGAVTGYRFAICGAGPVGLACAALLARAGVAPGEIALIDGKPLTQTLDDPRSIALSYGSRVLLDQLHAWPIASTPIHQIHISRAGRFGRTVIDRAEHDLEALGYVTRYGAIVQALAQACERAGIDSLRPQHVHATSEDDDGVELDLRGADGARTAIRAAIVVQAEGGVFAQQSAKLLQRDYGQSAVIALVTASSEIAYRAYERFTDEGPLALLPQHDAATPNGTGQYALVWCVRPATAERLLALGDDAFLAQLQQAFGQRLGRFIACTPRAAFALGLNAQQPGTPRTVAIGNAAQTLHPVAGQGLNLGLRDAYVLAGVLAKDGSAGALTRFEAQRRPDRSLTVSLTDGLARLFTHDGKAPGPAPLQAALGLSLGLLDTLAPARQTLAELMMYGRR